MTEHQTSWTPPTQRSVASAILLAVGIWIGPFAQAAEQLEDPLPPCGAAGMWVDPETGTTLGHNQVVRGLADSAVVLLGESHTSAEHHRWQLSMLASLHGQNPDIAVGFEAFPRRVQPVLDDWSQGRLGTDEFLARVEWNEVWGVDPDLYLPLLHFARMHRLPVVALNVERSLVSRIGAEGLDAVPEAEREGVGLPAPAGADYVRRLAKVYLGHQSGPAAAHGAETAEESPTAEDILDDPAFQRFVGAQQFWDRAMAEALRDASITSGISQVVGIVGRGHMEHGDGIPAQLDAMGAENHAVLLPSTVTDECADTAPGLARAAFLIDPVAEQSGPPRLRLGVFIETADGGARVERVVEDSVAEATGLAAGDVIVEAAGFPVDGAAGLIDIVSRQAPGTWLPLSVDRQGERLDFVAKFGPTDSVP